MGASTFEWWREGLVLVFCGKYREECLPSASHTPKEGRGAQTNFLWELQGLARLQYICHTFVFFSPTHMCSTESVDEGLSFSSGGLWSNTMVSVLARQNPLERMISKRDTGGDVGAAVESGGLGAQRGLRPCRKTTSRRWPDILTGLWKQGWIRWTLSFLSTWSSGDRSKNVNMTSDLEYCSVRVLVGKHLRSALKTDTLTGLKCYQLARGSHLARHVDGVLQQPFHLVQFLLDVVGLFDFHKPWKRNVIATIGIKTMAHTGLGWEDGGGCWDMEVLSKRARRNTTSSHRLIHF